MPRSPSTFLQSVARIGAGFLCLCSLQCSSHPQVTKGKDDLVVIQFPNDFLRKDPKLGFTKVVDSLQFEVRKISNSASGELLFAMDDYGEGYSDNSYAISLNGKPKVRQATVQEWNQAERIQNSRHDDDLFDEVFKGLVIDSQGVRYRAKLYRTETGASWTETKAFPSPGGKWIAVFSDTSKPANRPGIPGFSGGGRTSGVMTIDVYDTQSGEKILSGFAPHDGMGSYWFSMSLWVGDQFLVVPLDALGRKCFLGRLSKERQVLVF